MARYEENGGFSSPLQVWIRAETRFWTQPTKRVRFRRTDEEPLGSAESRSGRNRAGFGEDSPRDSQPIPRPDFAEGRSAARVEVGLSDYTVAGPDLQGFAEVRAGGLSGGRGQISRTISPRFRRGVSLGVSAP